MPYSKPYLSEYGVWDPDMMRSLNTLLSLENGGGMDALNSATQDYGPLMGEQTYYSPYAGRDDAITAGYKQVYGEPKGLEAGSGSNDTISNLTSLLGGQAAGVLKGYLSKVSGNPGYTRQEQSMRNRGDMAGSAIGNAIGSYWGPIGGIVGNLLGGMLGKAFGSKKGNWKQALFS